MSQHGCSRLPRCLRGDGEHASSCVASTEGKIVFFVSFTPIEMLMLDNAFAWCGDDGGWDPSTRELFTKLRADFAAALEMYKAKDPPP